MLFLISSAPDTKEFQTSFRTAKEMNADVCLLQNAVYAARSTDESSICILSDDMMLRGIKENETSGKMIDYGQLVDLMTSADRVVGFF